MTTAAMANSEAAGAESSNNNNEQGVQKATQAAIRFTADTTRAIGNLLPTASLQSLTTPKYTLPDKTVASQVLMYRQLLHTKCKPGLRLSRPYEGTPAQRAVLHMPWWEQGIEDSGKMVISYDNLIVRLWLNGAIMPHTKSQLLEINNNDGSIPTLIDDKGLPPVPHPYWVDRLGFQQQDPVTDFRSGGVLSLALLVHLVESCPHVVARFYGNGDAAVLPFGITGINVVDMMAKFLMFSKSVDKMDALLSQKPFWRMFGDPNAILALQEISMMMIADVVVEMGRERKIPGLVPDGSTSLHGEDQGKVTVFDFPQILERTEIRVRDDLLGAGPKTVEELRSIAGRLKVKYQTALERKERRALKKAEVAESPPGNAAAALGGFAGSMFNNTANVAGDVWNKFKSPLSRKDKPPQSSSTTAAPPTEVVDFEQPPADAMKPSAAASTAAAPPPADLLTPNSPENKTRSESDVMADDTDAVLIEAVGNFQIGDDSDDELL